MKLQVPYYKQETNVLCGPAVAQMVLRYFGKAYPSQKTLARIMKTDLVGEHGTKHRVLANYLRDKDLVVTVSRHASFWDIETALSKGFPVIVHYIEPAEQDDHYSVVISLTKSHVILNDPWNGKGLNLTRRDFDKRWRDKAGNYRRWMLVARPR